MRNINSNTNHSTSEITLIAKDFISNQVEVWKDCIDPRTGDRIVGYQVSSFGNVKSEFKMVESGMGRRLVRERILKTRDKSRHTASVVLYGQEHKVSRLMMASFTGKAIEKNIVVDHIDNNPKNNKYNNLQFLTRSQNRKKEGTSTKKVAVDIIDKNTGEFVGSYPSCSAAAKDLGYHRNTIARAIKDSGYCKDYIVRKA